MLIVKIMRIFLKTEDFIRLHWFMLISLLKSFYVILHYFPFLTAIRLPILVGANVKLEKLEGKIELTEIRRGIIKFGMVRGSFYLEKSCGFWHLGSNACLSFGGKADFAKGTSLIVDGNCRIGNNFYCNANTIINANREIIFGNNCLLGWNVTILDGDGHSVYDQSEMRGGKPVNASKPIVIADNVWLAANASILKGTALQHDSIVAMGCVLAHPIDESNVVIAGNPGRIVKRGITWKV